VPITGQPPDLARLPPGCAFAPRCPRADATCRATRPMLREAAALHLSACHHDDA
jgi:oligopeptide/dipeptide ABC transporter ATP-binding protein